MGMVQHKSLIVVSSELKDLKKVHKKANALLKRSKLGLEKCLSEIVGTGMNGTHAFFIAPCGSKLGWEMEQEFSEALELFEEYCYGAREDLSVETKLVEFDVE